MPPEDLSTRQVVGGAIQTLAAKRLGRIFVPIAVLGVVGVGEAIRGGGSALGTVLLLGGAVVSAAAALAFGLRVVQRALGRPHRAWMTLAAAGQVLPPVYGVYVTGWLGLRSLATGGGGSGMVVPILLTGVGVWLLRCWAGVAELERLARVMIIDPEE